MRIDSVMSTNASPCLLPLHRSGSSDEFLDCDWMSSVDPDWQPTVPSARRPVVTERTRVSPDGRVSVAGPVSTSHAVFEIRRLSGLDWDELAAVFDVSRSDICNWANGSVLSKREQSIVLRTLVAIRHVDRGTSDDTLSFLLENDDTAGTSVLELLRSERFDEVMAMPSRAVSRRPRPALSEDAKMLRCPAPPILLLDADHSRPVIATAPQVAEVMRAPSAEE